MHDNSDKFVDFLLWGGFGKKSWIMRLFKTTRIFDYIGRAVISLTLGAIYILLFPLTLALTMMIASRFDKDLTNGEGSDLPEEDDGEIL